MKTFLKHLAAVSAIALAAVPSAAWAITPAFEFDGYQTASETRPFTLGFEFRLSGTTLVDAFGYTDIGFAGTQTVGLWNAAGTLLATTDIAPEDALIGHFHWVDIAPLTLSAGVYRIAGTYSQTVNPYALTIVVTAPGYTWITDYQEFGEGLNYPTLSTGGAYGQNGLSIVNFSMTALDAAVPEPATWAMMIGGFALAGGALRRREAEKRALAAG
jgi:hypothetical protein